MPITPERVTRLREFGLSEYASRAYLALLDLGVAEARDVSTLSKVPQAKIYHVLEQLHEKGLAVILPEFPKKYAPVPFSDYLQRIHDEHHRAAQAIDREREVLAEMFRVLGDADVGNRGFFTVIRGRRNVITKIQEMLGEAKSDVLVLGTTGLSARHTGLLPDVQALHERGARLRILSPLTPETIAKLASLAPYAELRAREGDETAQGAHVAIIIVDSVRAFLINFLPDDDNLYSGKDIGVFTDQDAIVAALQSLLEPRWAAAATMEARREELDTGRIAEFTTVYRSMEAAMDAMKAATSRGFRELGGLDSAPAGAPTEASRELASTVRAKGATFRAILNVGDLATAEALRAIVAQSPGSEVRHLAPRLASRYWFFDSREAFFTIAPGDLASPAADDLIVHTTNPGVVASLRAQFDVAWARAMPLEQRAREIALFPLVHPRELGLGRLFHDIRDAIVVTDPDARIVLWNPAAEATFGYPVAEALGLRLSDIVEDAIIPSHTSAAGGQTQDLVVVGAKRKDGAAFEAEVSLLPASDSRGARFVLAHIRRADGGGRRVNVREESPPPRRRPS